MLEVCDLEKSYGHHPVLRKISFSAKPGTCVGIVGGNGCGKTTLLSILAGARKPDGGRILFDGQEAVSNPKIFSQAAAYVPQENPLIEELTVRDNLRLWYRGSKKELEKDLISGPAAMLGVDQMLKKTVCTLSGGMKKRLSIACALSNHASVLILDEPTNDLDIQTLTILEDYLDRFDGIIIIVSHDRYFLDRMVTRIFSFEGEGRIRQYEGGYSDYLIRKELEGLESLEDRKLPDKGKDEEKKSDSKATWKRREQKLKFSYKEQREYETIDGDIADLEEQVERLEEEIAANATNSAKLNELLTQKEEVEQKLEEKMERWVYLNDLAEQIGNQE